MLPMHTYPFVLKFDQQQKQKQLKLAQMETILFSQAEDRENQGSLDQKLDYFFVGAIGKSSLVAELSQTTTFSPKLVSILESVRKTISTRWNKNSIKQVQHYLISLTCQNKNLLHYKYLEDKNNNERCIGYIVEILTLTAKMTKQSRQNIVSLFLSHVLSHTSCYISYYTFYIVVEAVPEILNDITLQSLIQINAKIKRQQHAENFKVLESIRINQLTAFTQENIQLCQRNLQSFLWSQTKPYCPARNKQKSEKVTLTKIPPLLIPTSKSINSSRYSASREEKRKGLSQFQKLASNLGEGFITIELGCLLANKRTRQVQQFSQNEVYRERCLQKLDRIETERMNSSRLTLNKGLGSEYQEGEENAKKYYRKVLTVNLNICLKKLPLKFKIMEWINRRIDLIKKKTENGANQVESQNYITCLYQIFDMSLVGMINLSLDERDRASKKQQIYHYDKPIDIFTILTRNLKTITQVTKQIIAKIVQESEKLHLNLLLNRNKGDSFSCSHFSFSDQAIQLSDEFLADTEILVNEHHRVEGLWKDQKKVSMIKKYSDPILLYLGSWLQSLQQLADMNHPMFYFYQTNTLKAISFYLQSCGSKVAHYYFAQYIFKLILMVKREIMELSHPYLSVDPSKTGTIREPLSHKYPALVDNFIGILTALLETSSRHIEKMFANVFIKNVYFMETIQNYFQHVVKEENMGATVSMLRFYKKCLEVYSQSTRKQTQSTHKASESNPLYFLFQHIADYLCPRNGCISSLLTKYENFISPTNLDDFDEEDNIEFNKFNTQISTHGLGSNRKFQHNVQTYLHQIFMFVAHAYYLASSASQDSLLILEEDICSFYIKYSIMNFIKLYSLLTVSEIANINGINSKQDLDCMLSTKQSPHYPPKINTKQIFMIDFLKILTNISINRTPEIAKKFRQHRVLQFFVREIELEFSVRENIEKYIKRAIEIKSVTEIMAQHQEKLAEREMEEKKMQKMAEIDKKAKQETNGNKKISIPNLNLAADFFKKQGQTSKKQTSEEQKEKEKEKEKEGKQGAPKGKKFMPSLKIPLKTEQSVEKKEKNKKGFLDDLVDEIVVPKNIKKKSFKDELNLNLKLDVLNLSKDKSLVKSKSSRQGGSDATMIYFTERKIRKIYSNKILHAESIMLILSLILYKGQLDPIYCDQIPNNQGKLNVLYILHYHLNHDKNKSIIPILSESVSKITPALSGQRLFKLLSNHFTDLSHYYDWTKINAGAFGVIMSAKTHMHEPKEVAIKKMNFPESIYRSCVLNDIFTEITSLEMFRLEDRVTRMYNYGVHDNTYVIIMKKYPCSLRDWRLGNTDSTQAKLFPPTLPNILALFYQVIRGLKLLHDQNVTHYDIKGDNILLEFVPRSDPREPPKVNIVFGDFGVAKIYEDDKDELDLKSRGTECIMSPEMLTIALKNKKEADNFDRRKKIGTTKASDIWSLGCLLYEMVTGQFLFNSNDWSKFFLQVTSPNEEVLNSSNCQKMKNNIYLIDFIKYILIRDPQHRPSIQNIICRFESLYALLVTNPERTASENLREVNHKSLDQMVKEMYNYIKSEEKQEGNIVASKRLKSEGQFGRTRKVMEIFNSKNTKLIKIMEDIYFCEREHFVVDCQQVIRKQGITHVITEEPSRINRNKFKVIGIKCKNPYSLSECYRVSPRISDVLRQVLLMKGKLLFVNSDSNFCVNLLIFTLSYWFKCSAYETWCLINTQILEFPTFTTSIIGISHASFLLSRIQQEIYELPKLQCICGSVTIILKKKFQEKRGDLKVCKCKKNKGDSVGCFSKHCPTYLELINKRYNIVWDHLTWTLASKSQILTPLFDPTPQEVIESQLILNSGNPLSNMITESKQSDEWKVYQCKTCEMWVLATNYKEIWLILNNLIKSCRQGIMIPNAQQDFKARTPALNYYTLSKLHMTQ